MIIRFLRMLRIQKILRVLFKAETKGISILFKLYASAFGQESLESNVSSHRLVIALYVMFIFWFMQYFTSFISTDLTVSIPEIVIDSLDDLHRHKLQPMLMRGMNVELVLRSSNQKSADQVLDTIKKNESLSILEMDQQNILSILSKVFERKAGYIIDAIFWSATQFASCVAYGARAMEYRRSKEIIASGVSYGVSSVGIPAQKMARIHSLNTKLFTSGLHQYQYTMKGTMTTDFFLYASAEQRLCLFKMRDGGNDDLDTEEVDPFGLYYIKFIFFLFLGGVVGAMLIFIFVEPIVHKFSTNQLTLNRFDSRWKNRFDSRWKKNVERKRNVRSWKEFKSIEQSLNH